jgi:hypothetical protein
VWTMYYVSLVVIFRKNILRPSLSFDIVVPNIDKRLRSQKQGTLSCSLMMDRFKQVSMNNIKAEIMKCL